MYLPDKDAEGRKLPCLNNPGHPVYLTFRKDIDCIGCDPHINNLLFEAEDYRQGIILYCTPCTPHDLNDFLKEAALPENFFLITALKKPPFTPLLRKFFKKNFYMDTLLSASGKIVNKKVYHNDKNHLEYTVIKDYFLKEPADLPKNQFKQQ